MSNLGMNPILEGLHEARDPRKQILKTEGTTSSDISTPSGKLNPKEGGQTYTCPECGSTDVIITDEGKFHCTKCEYEWRAEDITEKKKKRKVVEAVSHKVSDISELPWWDVRYTYEGDTLSDYAANIWVQAETGDKAVKRAEKYLKEKNRVSGPEIHRVSLDSPKPISDSRLNNKNASNIEKLPA